MTAHGRVGGLGGSQEPRRCLAGAAYLIGYPAIEAGQLSRGLLQAPGFGRAPVGFRRLGRLADPGRHGAVKVAHVPQFGQCVRDQP